MNRLISAGCDDRSAIGSQNQALAYADSRVRHGNRDCTGHLPGGEVPHDQTIAKNRYQRPAIARERQLAQSRDLAWIKLADQSARCRVPDADLGSDRHVREVNYRLRDRALRTLKRSVVRAARDDRTAIRAENEARKVVAASVVDHDRRRIAVELPDSDHARSTGAFWRRPRDADRRAKRLRLKGIRRNASARGRRASGAPRPEATSQTRITGSSGQAVARVLPSAAKASSTPFACETGEGTLPRQCRGPVSSRGRWNSRWPSSGQPESTRPP